MSSPNNTIDWGQGAVNNDIGWGQAASSNSINWGYIHQFSYGHPETNLVGASPAMQAAEAYQVRVLADSGTIEGYQCMVDKLTFLFDNP
jgi:hypothetical protein